MDLDDATNLKRQRTTPAPEVSHISDSVNCNSQAVSFRRLSIIEVSGTDCGTALSDCP